MRSRAMTLLEVLAAAALLAILVAACLPWMSSMYEGQADRSEISAQELGWIADQVLASPEEYGLVIESGSSTMQRIAFQDDRVSGTEDLAVTVRWSEDPELDHGWVSFEAGAVAVSRWIEKPTNGEAGP